MKVLLIDGNSIANRAFFGVRPLTAPDGTPTNAISGFFSILRTQILGEKPDAVCVAFDRHEPTFRHRFSEEYKATRHGMPEELAVQMPIIKQALDALGIFHCDLSGWEADDILGTLSLRAQESGNEAVIVTGDKDSLQLVGEHVRVLNIKTKAGQTEIINYTPERFTEEYGFAPEYLVDLKALMGDSSDNIPGVPGVGEKTAMTLIQTFGSLDGVYANLADERIKAGVRSKLEAGEKSARDSFYLAKIDRAAPLETGLEEMRYSGEAGGEAYALFRRLGMNKIIEKWHLVPESVKATEVPTPQGCQVPEYHDIKPKIRAALEAGKEVPDFDFDTALAAYLLDATASDYNYATLCSAYGANPDSDELRQILLQKLEEQGLQDLFFQLELPLCTVLARMEAAGVLVDRAALAAFGDGLVDTIAQLENRIWTLAGEKFNIKSPKQLGSILFEKLGLPGGKKTKSGWSTNVDVLEKLRYEEIVRDVLEYRELTKLQSTYVEGLLKEIRQDGRIHTTFQNLVTATGRLSSTEPNLQNIPVRRELGSALRNMFVAPEGWVLVDADYSQIELRLLAHISGDENMQNAFLSGEDVHRVTASQVFAIPLEQVTAEERRRAKAVNFGIVYGISAFSLAGDIGSTVAEAKSYIEAYLQRFSGVREYLKKVVADAYENGYVKTLFGRRRAMPELKNTNYALRSFGERVAMNMPIQGTAADIIKMAMLRVDDRLRREDFRARLILQVHDELILECPEEEALFVSALLKEEMEHTVDLSVPLTVEVGIGHSWGEAH